MKKFLFVFFISLASLKVSAQDIPKPTKPHWCFNTEIKPDNCMIKGFTMNAKVKIVKENENPTFKVRTVKDGESGEDLTVRFVKYISSSGCGQWQIVETWEDFTVAFVDNNEDFIVRIAE